MKRTDYLTYSFTAAILGLSLTASALIGCGARKDSADSTSPTTPVSKAQAQVQAQQQVVQTQGLEQQLKAEGFEFNTQNGDQVYLNSTYKGYTPKLKSLLSSYINLAYEALTNIHIASQSDDMNYAQGSLESLILRKLQISQRFMAAPASGTGAQGYNPASPSWE